MKTNSLDQYWMGTVAQDEVFNALRKRLSHEVSSSAVLLDLFEKIKSMQEAQDSPQDFKERFQEFLPRAEEYFDVIRPYCPALVAFLPCRRTDVNA